MFRFIKYRSLFLACLLVVLLALAACGGDDDNSGAAPPGIAEEETGGEPDDGVAVDDPDVEPQAAPTGEPAAASDTWQPAPGTTWQWQLLGEINTSHDVTMYDIDLFDAPQDVIDRLQANGRIVICYFSAGSWENWREDAAQFSDAVLGEALDGWPDEKWLDVRQIELLAAVMLPRLDYAVQRGCDGVEPDNMDGYINESGFPLSYDDQLVYNIWIAEQAHQRGLSVGLKNDLDQIENLVAYYDWGLNEECFYFEECDLVLPFIEANKAVFGVEYEGDPADYCPQAIAMNLSWLTKTLDLDDEPVGACQ